MRTASCSLLSSPPKRLFPRHSLYFCAVSKARPRPERPLQSRLPDPCKAHDGCSVGVKAPTRSAGVELATGQPAGSVRAPQEMPLREVGNSMKTRELTPRGASRLSVPLEVRVLRSLRWCPRFSTPRGKHQRTESAEPGSSPSLS